LFRSLPVFKKVDGVCKRGSTRTIGVTCFMDEFNGLGNRV